MGTETQNTLEMKKMVHSLGNNLGLVSDTEISEASVNIRIDHEHIPAVDAAWYLNTSRFLNLDPLRILEGRFDIQFIKYLPLVGFEIEGSDPTSKTQIANAANLFVQHYPYGFLVIDEQKGAKDLYRRAAKILRTFRFQFGNMNYLPLSKSQLTYLTNHLWKEPLNERIQILKSKQSKGIGGEINETNKIRQELFKIGIKANFTVYSDWSPEDLSSEYNLRDEIIKQIKDPTTSQRRFLGKEISYTPNKTKSTGRWNEFYIKPKLDITWCIGLPLRFQEFINEVIKLDTDFRYNLQIFRKPSEPFPIIGFEIEGGTTKHSGGGILNLSRYSHFGFVVIKKANLSSIERKIKTYSRNLGINNVWPITFEEILK